MRKNSNLHKKNFVTYVKHLSFPEFVVKGTRGSFDKNIRKWVIIRAVIGASLCVVLSIGAYVAITRYIIPSTATIKKPVDGPASVVSEEESKISETIKYDAKTGLPIYDNSDVLFYANAKNPLPDDYSPSLIKIEGIIVNGKMADALNMMVTKAKKDGIELVFETGYLTQEEQSKLYEDKINELITKEKYTKIMARAKAKTFVAKPGEADAQTGFCVTIKEDKDKFSNSAVHTWLNKFSADYGFVFRYPEDKSTLTHIEADNRILRFVGAENAIKMRQLSMCLEEYVSYLKL